VSSCKFKKNIQVVNLKIIYYTCSSQEYEVLNVKFLLYILSESNNVKKTILYFSNTIVNRESFICHNSKMVRNPTIALSVFDGNKGHLELLKKIDRILRVIYL